MFGGARLHVVVLDDSAQIVEAHIWAASETSAAAESLVSCDVVAIDSPDRWSPGMLPEHAHRSPKFAGARCAEFALGQSFGIWVPWVTPPEPLPNHHTYTRYEWMRRGMELFARLDGKPEAIEVYPHSIYCALAGTRTLRSKSTLRGVKRRVELVRGRGITERDLEMWSHDSLDALAAAVVALDRQRGMGREVTCGHDGSAMWLPALAEGEETGG